MTHHIELAVPFDGAHGQLCGEDYLGGYLHSTAKGKRGECTGSARKRSQDTTNRETAAKPTQARRVPVGGFGGPLALECEFN